MTMRSIFLALSLSVIAAGCATPYKPNLAGQPSANIRMLSNHTRISWAGLLKDACVPSTTFGWESGSDNIGQLTARSNPRRTSIGMPLQEIPAETAFIETAVPANSPISVGFSTLGLFHVQACGAGIQFTPQQGADYQVTYNGESAMSCSISVSKIVKTPEGAVVLEPVPNASVLPRC